MEGKRFDKEMADKWWSMDGGGFLNRYHCVVSISLETCSKSSCHQPCQCLHDELPHHGRLETRGVMANSTFHYLNLCLITRDCFLFCSKSTNWQILLPIGCPVGFIHVAMEGGSWRPTNDIGGKS
jgi:hypothetical protein